MNFIDKAVCEVLGLAPSRRGVDRQSLTSAVISMGGGAVEVWARHNDCGEIDARHVNARLGRIALPEPGPTMRVEVTCDGRGDSGGMVYKDMTFKIEATEA